MTYSSLEGSSVFLCFRGEADVEWMRYVTLLTSFSNEYRITVFCLILQRYLSAIEAAKDATSYSMLK